MKWFTAKVRSIGKMPGDEWQKFANLRLLFGYMYAQPGKKMLFMGCEFGQVREWAHDTSLEWHVLQYPVHRGVQNWVAQLNQVYREQPALHQLDTDSAGFEWVDCNDTAASVISLLRKSRTPADEILIVCNFTPGAALRIPRRRAFRRILAGAFEQRCAGIWWKRHGKSGRRPCGCHTRPRPSFFGEPDSASAVGALPETRIDVRRTLLSAAFEVALRDCSVAGSSASSGKSSEPEPKVKRGGRECPPFPVLCSPRPAMRILTRYILSEVISHAAIGIAVFTFVLFTRDLGHILDLVVRNSAPLPSVLEIFIFTLPVAFTYTIPMGVLVGILIGLSRLAADSEITAMRASGIGVWTFLRVVSIFAVTAWALAMFNAVYLAPESQAALGRLEDRLKTSQASFEVQPRVFYEGFPKLVLYVQDVKTRAGRRNLERRIHRRHQQPGVAAHYPGPARHSGQRRAADAAPSFDQRVDPRNRSCIGRPLSDLDFRPDRYTAFPFRKPTAGTRSRCRRRELLTWDLREQARKVKKYVAPWYLIEFHRRFALPTSCLVLALVGIPLGLSSKKGGKSAGFVLTILLVFAYYSVTLIGVSLARQGKVPPALGAWLANIVFFLGGAFLLWRAERRPFEIGSFRAKLEPAENQTGARRKEPAPLQPARRRLPASGQPAPRVQRQLSHDPGRLRPAGFFGLSDHDRGVVPHVVAGVHAV